MLGGIRVIFKLLSCLAQREAHAQKNAANCRLTSTRKEELTMTARGGGGKRITNTIVTTRKSNTQHDNKPKGTATHTTTNQEEKTSIQQQHTAGPVVTNHPHKQLETRRTRQYTVWSKKERAAKTYHYDCVVSSIDAVAIVIRVGTK
jgi:hypothetical protein